MKIGKFSLFLFLLLYGLLGFSQSIQRNTFFSCAGGYSDVGTMQVQSNIGELMPDTYVNAQGILSQGFVQPETMLITLTDDHAGTVNMDVFPNPVSQQLYLKFDPEKITDIRIEVYDVLGKKQVVDLGRTKGSCVLSMESLQDGIYFIRIYSLSANYSHTFKVNKV